MVAWDGRRLWAEHKVVWVGEAGDRGGGGPGWRVAKTPSKVCEMAIPAKC